MSEAAGNVPTPAPEPPASLTVPQQPGGNRIMLWLSVLCLLVGLGAFAWSRITGSESYQVRQELSRAEQLARDGKLDEAAQAYRDLASRSPKHTSAALSGFKKMLGKSFDGAPLGQAAIVLNEAANWPDAPYLRDGLGERALTMLRERGDKDVDAALVLLNAVASTATDQKQLETVFREGDELLEGWVKKFPDNIKVLVNFAHVLLRKNDAPGSEKLLAPHRKELGKANGVTVLVEAYLRQGKNDEALALLEPFCKERVPILLKADADYRRLRGELEGKLLPEIEAGTAEGFDFDEYRTSDPGKKQFLRVQYVAKRLREDPTALAAEKVLQPQRLLLPQQVKILGQLQVGKARAEVDLAARKAWLTKARETFLALHDTVFDNPEFFLLTADVAYALGEPKEGQKVLDELLKKTGRAPQMLLQVAETYRSVGEPAVGRGLIEEVYDKAAGDEVKYEAAFRRARMEIDVADQIAWLKKCDTKRPDIQVVLLRSQARQAELKDQYTEAAEHLRKSVDLLAKFKESPQSNLEIGVAWLDLFRVTGDRSNLDKGLAVLEKTTSGTSDPLIIRNAAQNIYQAACLDLVMETIEKPVLRVRQGLNLLDFLYNDRPGRDEQASRIRKHAGLTRARELAEKLLKLQPRQILSYEVLAALRAWDRDVKGLKELEAQLTKTGVNESDLIEGARETFSGKHDERFREERRKGIERWEKLAGEMREKKKERSLAVALSSLISALLLGERVGEPIDADKLVKLAEEAQTAQLCRATTEKLVDALLYRGHRQLILRDPEYKKMAERARRSLDSSHLIALALTREGPAQALAAANADVVRACKLLKERSEAFPDEPSPWMYAMLKTTHPDTAAKVAEALRTDEVQRTMRAITLKLKPLSLPDVLEHYWALKLEGKDKDSEALLRKLGERGVPLPFDAAK